VLQSRELFLHSLAETDVNQEKSHKRRQHRGDSNGSSPDFNLESYRCLYQRA
jgi:hypothetical protein